ncbi:unnamed protein product [Sphenostylis stenocarpa]|uniref:Uncharacterized protein n=1 Tax=Sphenostylis stenocarpa TaxID=92480 RepID=A0AA86SXX2_9FABA|nr:unnamed protein product [Sphenostylis stenocarpa]
MEKRSFSSMQYLSTVIAENFLAGHSTYILTFSAEVSSATKSETTLELRRICTE